MAQQQYELNFQDYWRIIKKKKAIVIFSTIILSIFSLIFAIMNRPAPLYRATTSIKIEKSSSLSSYYYQSLSWGSGDDLATRAEVIKSYPMIEKAAQRMGLLDSTLTSEEIRNDQQLFSVVSRLKNRVDTEQEGYTNLINIIVTDLNAQRATDLANSLATVYEVESFNEKSAQYTQTLNAIKIQLEQAEENLREIEKKVQTYKEKHRFVALDGEAVRLSNQLNIAETNLEEMHADIKQIEEILVQIDLDDDYIFYTSFNLLLNRPSRALDAMQNQLNQYKSELGNFRNHYTDEHPAIQELERNIANTRRRFITELESLKETLEQSYKKEEERFNKLDSDYKSLPLQRIELSNLERELAVKTQIYQQLEIRYQESLIKQSEQVKEVFIVRPAFKPRTPINPSMISQTTIIGIIIGVVLGVILAFIAETLDTTFRTIEDIEKTLDTTVRGVIPFVPLEEIKQQLEEDSDTPISDDILQMRARLVSHYNPKSTIAESFRGLRTNVNFALMEKGHKTLLVTSSVASEGKTTCAINLAVSMAQIGMRTLLVEADLRKPRVSRTFGIDKEPGLTDVILRRKSLDSVIRTMSDLMLGNMATDTLADNNIPGIEFLNILTSGKIERNPSELIADRRMGEIIDQLKENYDLVIFDSAPVIQATDSSVLSSKVDSVILVYYQGKISRGTLRRSMNQLRMLHSDISGVIINGMKADVSADYADYKYSYNYHYTYGDHPEVLRNKVADSISKFFLKPKEEGVSQLESSFWSFIKRLYKYKVAGILAVIAAIITGVILTINAVKKPAVTQETAAKVTEHSSLDSNTAPQYQTIQSKEINRSPNYTPQPQTSIPEGLQQLKSDYGLPTEPKHIPEPNEAYAPPPIHQSIQTRPDQTKPAVSVKQIGAPAPWSLFMGNEPTFESARNKIDQYRSEGIAAFAVPRFSYGRITGYGLLYGNFPSSEDAAKQIRDLRFLGFTGQFNPIRMPFSFMADTYPKKDGKFVKPVDLPDIYTHYKYGYQPNGKYVQFILVSAFKDTEESQQFQSLFTQYQELIPARK